LRTREWAIEFEDSTIEFILEKGFTADLGARPLKRAIERYLLSPLAITIVEHKFPQGDQFLFVRSDGEKIFVEFIDPDVASDEPGSSPVKSSQEDLEKTEKNLKTIILNTLGSQDEVDLLKSEFDKIQSIVDSDNWNIRKEKKLLKMSDMGFWDSADRFKILGDVEYMDRIESGFKTALSLINRLTGSQTKDRKLYSQSLIERLAQQLYLLGEATTSLVDKKPYDAYLIVEANSDFKLSDAVIKEFAGQIQSMYQNWAKKRRMKLNILNYSENKKLFYKVSAVSGFGAYSILDSESGLHVLESPKNEKSFDRYKVNVRIIPQPEIPIVNLLDHLDSLISQESKSKLEIVRRYRSEPSPLVRDAKNNWRTGRLDSVLDGNFDLFV